MAKMIVKTSEQIRKEWPLERVRAMLDKAPVFHDDITAEDIATGRVRPMGRGFASYMEHINRGGRPKKAVKKVNVGIRLPEPVVADMRAVRGYSSILAEYIMAGISSGALKFAPR